MLETRGGGEGTWQEMWVWPMISPALLRRVGAL